MAGAFEPEVAQVTSNDLEATVRNLLPSVAGFGSRLGAQNVIVPIIDLTATAEGSTLPESLQQAIAYGNQTAFSITNTSSTIADAPGFYRVFGVSSLGTKSGIDGNSFQLSDGVTPKIVWRHQDRTSNLGGLSAIEFDFVVFLAADESIIGVTDDTVGLIAGSVRQIADVNGILVNPSGFTTL